MHVCEKVLLNIKDCQKAKRTCIETQEQAPMELAAHTCLKWFALPRNCMICQVFIWIYTLKYSTFQQLQAQEVWNLHYFQYFQCIFNS